MTHTLNDEEYKTYMDTLERNKELEHKIEKHEEYLNQVKKNIKAWPKKLKSMRKWMHVDTSEYIFQCDIEDAKRKREEDPIEYWCDHCLWSEILNFCPYGHSRSYSQ
jgi:hypothetical protein